MSLWGLVSPSTLKNEVRCNPMPSKSGFTKACLQTYERMQTNAQETSSTMKQFEMLNTTESKAFEHQG